jgi:hypothetical protein
MARGWESKSVEEQQAESAASRGIRGPVPTSDELLRRKQRQELALARTHVIQQLEKAQNPNHRKVLEAALADLDARSARLG